MEDSRNQRFVELLPRDMRPKYETRKDLRLLARAYREGWVKGVPKERQREWCDDLCEMMKNNSDVHDLIAAIKLVRAAEQFENRQSNAATL